MLLQGTQKCWFGSGQAHMLCSWHQSMVGVGLSGNWIPGPFDWDVVGGVWGEMTTGGLGDGVTIGIVCDGISVGGLGDGVVIGRWGLVVWAGPHSSSDSSELSMQFGKPLHLSPWKIKKFND